MVVRSSFRPEGRVFFDAKRLIAGVLRDNPVLRVP